MTNRYQSSSSSSFHQIIIWLLCCYTIIIPVRLNPLINDDNHNLSTTINDEQQQQQNVDVIISSGDSSSNDDKQQQQQLNPIAQFNDRRRDMFFEDYSVKQIQVVDTIANNTINGNGGGLININKYKSNKKKITQLPLAELSISTASTIEIMNNQSTTTTTTTTTTTPIPIELNFQLKPQRPNILLPKLEQTGRPSCLTTPDDTFCENVDNYPKSIIKQEVDFSVDQFAEIFGNKEIDGRTIMDVENDESVCGKTPRVIYPKMAKNQANQWIYVVNEVEYTQAVVAEICQRPGKPCAYMDSLPMGMSSMCKQKYSYKRLLALHPTEKRTYPDAFRFPSCCSCYIKTIDDFMARSNFRKIDKPITVVDTIEPKLSSSPESSSSSIIIMDDNNNEQSILNITMDNINISDLDLHKFETIIMTSSPLPTTTIMTPVQNQTFMIN